MIRAMNDDCMFRSIDLLIKVKSHLLLPIKDIYFYFHFMLVFHGGLPKLFVAPLFGVVGGFDAPFLSAASALF